MIPLKNIGCAGSGQEVVIEQRTDPSVVVSAKTGLGFDRLRRLIEDQLETRSHRVVVKLRYEDWIKAQRERAERLYGPVALPAGSLRSGG